MVATDKLNHTKIIHSMKSILALIALFVSMSFSFGKDCPVTGKAAGAEKVEYSKKIGFCCDKCKAKFDADPKAMVEKIAAYKTADNKCIVSGKAVDAAQSSEFKAEISVCCKKCKAKVSADPDTYIAKAVK
jgi:YHS domain-containing protein